MIWQMVLNWDTNMPIPSPNPIINAFLFVLPSLKTSIGAGLEDLSACRNEVIVDTLETYDPR